MSAATSFIPNGLLGGRKDEGFTPNGLLSTKVKESSMCQEMKEVVALSQLKPNGLLGSGQTSNSSSIPQSSLAASSSFVSNGLLSSSRTPPPSTPSQGVNLPELHELINIQSVRSSTASVSGPAPSRLTIRATTFDGKTVYLRRKPKTTARRKLETQTSGRRVGCLLDVPMHQLLDELSRDTAISLANQHDQDVPLAGTEIEDVLWVDRYRPRQFTDLMGNERVAREAMGWLKQWDKCVFGKSFGKKRKRDSDESFDAYDPYQRPKEKILLISGPPGLGKTTLAHVVAKQAGYEIMEINASDSRSGQIVDDRIRPALESGYTVKSSKPVLLIIDEIDGATGAGENSSSFIHKLVQLTQDKPKKKGRSGNQEERKSNRTILRPIICICNDINAASLTKLRPHAYQVRFQKPSDVHTVKRLREICTLEGLRADSRALSTLVSVAKGDLRGCLNTLQFIKSRKEEVTEMIIRGATKGMKEADSSVTSALNYLFTPLSKKRAKDLSFGDAAETRYVGRLSREIEACGKDSAIAVGCFSHYVTLRRHDANFSRFEKANEWLTTFDLLSAAMYTDGDFALNSYLPYTLVPFYPLFQERGAPRVERNQDDWDNFQTTRTNEEIYKSLGRCLQLASTRHGGAFRHLGNAPILQLELAPYLNRIISPPLRPVNSQIVRPDERAVMMRLVSIMSALELRFIQERADDGQLTYRLDPAVDVFVTYDGKRASDIAVSRYAVRHLIAQEVDAQLGSRQPDVTERKPGRNNFFGRAKDVGEPNASASRNMSAPSKRPRTEIDIADRPPTDFFGRLVDPSTVKSTNSMLPGSTGKKYHVSYRFKEGNSAALNGTEWRAASEVVKT